MTLEPGNLPDVWYRRISAGSRGIGRTEKNNRFLSVCFGAFFREG